ncbi:MAG: amidohydrolase family protein [Desulfovermiculus sp.]|nr:amidohydrolase family protein [Desulfovermiculus sp.]
MNNPSWPSCHPQARKTENTLSAFNSQESKPLALSGATIITGTGQVIDNGLIVIKDQKILAVDEVDQVVVPSEAEHIDITGKTVMPGLIDAHVHLDMHGMPDTYHESLVEDKLRTIRACIEMANTVRAGITTVRNAGSANYIDIAVKKAVEEGLVTGPRILASGKIICMMTAGSEYFQGLYREADGVDENRRAAREQLKEGADLLKVMATGAIMNPGGTPGAPHLNVEEIQAVVEEGEKTGKYTAAHAHGAEGIKNAIKAGVRTIEHGTLADDEALKMMADQGVFLTSTLCSNFWMLNGSANNGVPQFMFQKAEEVSKIRVDNLHRALRAGVRVAMGTDAGTPYNYHGRNAMELIQYVDKGIMDPMQAIEASTRVAADAVGLLTETGTLEPGKMADLLILRADPLGDMHCLMELESIHCVLKAGQVVHGKVDTSQWSEGLSLGLN